MAQAGAYVIIRPILHNNTTNKGLCKKVQYFACVHFVSHIRSCSKVGQSLVSILLSFTKS